MLSIYEFITKHKKKLFFLTILLYIVLISFVKPPKFIGELTGFKLENNDQFQHYDKMDSIFNFDAKIFLLIKPKNDNLKQVFEGIDRLRSEIQIKYPLCEISSIDDFYSKMIRHWKKKDNSLQSFYTAAKQVPILKNLLSKNNESFLMIVSFPNKKKLKVEELDSILTRKYPSIASVQAMSTFHVEKAIEKSMIKDVGLISLLIILLFVIFFSLIFRHIYAIFYTSIVVFISLTSLLFLFQIFDFNINLISIISIPILLVLTLSDAQHLLTGYIKNNTIENKEERIKQTLKHYFVPSFLSSLTTSTAFLSFYFFNESAYIKEFGLITAISLIFEFIVIFTLAPFLLNLFNLHLIYDRKVNGISHFLSRYQKTISLSLVAVFIASIFLVDKMKFYTDSEMFFPSNSEIIGTHKEMMKNYYATVPLNIFIQDKTKKSNESYLFDNTSMLVKTIEHNTLVKNINTPTGHFLFKSKLGMKVDLLAHLGSNNPYYDAKTRTCKIEIFFNKTKDILTFKNQYLKVILGKMPKDLKVSYSSPTILLDEINKSVSKSLINSIFSSFIVIFGIILLVSRSLKIALLSLIPNLIPLGFIVVIFYLLGLNINILTAITGVVCLGLLDDDTIHILYRKIWLKENMEELSFSVLSTAILLIIGFSLFLTSSFEPIRVFGCLSAFVFFIGVVCEMTIMQWVLNKIKDYNSFKKKSQLTN
ncbi:MAG: MMPL family transporter [Flavobacteriia bacterium]|jgi:predicted RND superfamily exporter protein